MILAIETSCDETSVAIINNGKILANIISSQIPFHQKYGGVMPEVASRLHTKVITLIINEALEKSNIKLNEITAIAVTRGPGLMGSLHIGLQSAKALAIALNKPLITVNHMAGHIYSNNIEQEINYPALSLVVSGGHTELVYLESELKFQILGATLDDAVGEVYDKVARILNLGYPGGPVIDKLSRLGEHKYKLPLPKNDDSLDFSFSGLKTSVLSLVNNLTMKKESYKVEDIATSFQNTVVNILVKKVAIALSKYSIKDLLLAGGVAANSQLRNEMLKFANNKIRVLVPPMVYCGDNAAMIGIVAEKLEIKQKYDKLNIGINPGLKLEE